MKKKFFLGLGIVLMSVLAYAAIGQIKGKVTGNAVVNMTYVDADAPTTAFGEVTTAVGGYNKISGGTVAMANSAWGVNKIIYLNVDISGVKTDRMIKKVTLYAECSGSTDSKRTTGWGVGWNESDWSADMTYETADKSIMLCGDVAWTSTKSSAEYETLSWDISDAFARADPSVTILVYETNAAGGNFRNPYVVVEEEPLLFDQNAPTNVPAAVVTYLQGEGNSAPAGCQDSAFYDAGATVWKADQSKISGGAFSNMLTSYGGTQVTLAKFDLSEYELPFDYEIESVSLSLHAQCTVSGKNSNIHGMLIPNTDIDLTKATWNNTNTAAVLGEMTDLGTIGNGNSSGVTMSKDITELYNNAEQKVFMFGFYTETGRNQDLSDIKLIVNIKPIVHETELSYFVAKAIEEAGDADVVYDLDPAIEYTLNTPVVTGTKKVTINGGGRTLVVDSVGQFRIKEDLVLNDINFDCAASALPLIALDSMKVAADTAYCWNKYGANGKDAFFMENIKLMNVNVSGLTTSLIKSEAPWAIRNVSILNSIVQMNQANKFITINLQEGGNGMIQNIDVENSTLYNIVADMGYFIAYNANNPGKKFWGEEDANSTWVMKNNTFANIYGDKMGDRYTEQKTNTITWIGNIFYAVGNLSKIRNCTVTSTPADNTTGGTNCGNNTGYATVDSTLVFTVPETNLDLANIDLKANFTPGNGTYAADNELGDPRWAGVASGVFFANNYEKDQTVDWKTSVGGRFDPIVTVENGNHFLCANPAATGNNGAVLSTINTAILAAGTDFTASVDIRLGSSNDQTATQFAIYDATNSVKLLSVAETGKNVTTWFINGGTDTLDLPGTENGNYVEGRPWYNFTLSFAAGTAFLTIKDVATGAIVGDYDKKVVPCQSADGGIGKMEFTTSRYISSFAIDNVKVRELKDGDLPEGLIPTKYTVNYLFTDNTPLKEPRVANAFVGQKVAALASDIAPIYVRDSVETILGKYLIQTGANDTIELVQDPGSNNIYLVFREANKYNLGLKANYGDNLDKQLDLGQVLKVWEGETATLWYPEFILDGDSLWFKNFGVTTANQFTYDNVMTSSVRATIDYEKKYSMFNTTDAMIKNVVFYKEAEDIEGFTVSEQPNQGVRCSMGKCAYNLEDVVLCTLEPGTYLVGNQFWGGTSSATWEIGKIAVGKDTLTTSCTGSRGQAYKMVTVTETTDVVAKAIPQGENYTMAGYDWILVQKFVDASILTQNAKLAAGDSVDVTEFVSSTSSAAITYKSSDENVAKVEDGKLIAVGKGVATITVNQAAGNGFNAATATFDVTVTELAVLPEIAANAYYSWQSPAGEVEEVGGKAVAIGDTTRVNYANTTTDTQFFTICLVGKKGLEADKDGIVKYITVNLDKALTAGDTICVYAFKNKDDASKKSGVKFFWGAEGTSNATACGDDFPNLYNGGEPALVKYVVPADADGETTFRMTRSDTGTNLFIAQLYIVPQQTPTGINDINGVNPFEGQTMYNIRGMKVNSVKAGDIFIVNGKKYIQK